MVPLHEHHAIQIVIGIDGNVAIKGEEGDWQLSRGVVVRPAHSATRVKSEGRDRLAERLREVFADARLLGLSTANTRSFVVNELRRWSSQEKLS